MEEEKRDQKLRAGKEKLAQFQRKKRKKKPRTEETEGSPVPAGESANIVPPLQAVSDIPFACDSDTLTTSSCSEDDTDSAQEWSSRSQLRLKSKLQERSQRVEELEESLVGKQLALDKVIQENEKLKTLISHVKHPEVSDANHNAVASKTESQNQSSPVNGTTENQSAEDGAVVNGADSQEFSMSDVQELLHHVQWLQLQLKQANSTLQTQNEKQKETAGALHNAKEEIVILQDSITQKDKLLNELIEKMKQISMEYDSFKQHYAKQAENKNSNMVEELERQCKTVEEMNTALKEELQKVSFEKENEIQKLLEKQGVKIDELTEEYEMKIKELESELQEIRTTNEEQKLNLDKIMNENVGLQSYCDTLTKGLEFLKEEHEKAVTELNELSVGFKVLKSEYDVLVEEKGQCELQAESWKAELDSNRIEKQELIDEISELKKVNECLEKELEGTNERLEVINLEHQQYFHDNKILADELTKQKEDNAMYQNQIAEYEDKLSEGADILEENYSLHGQNDDLNNRINNQKDVIASLKNELEVLSMENSQVVDQVKDLSADFQKIRKENEDLKTEKEQLLNEVRLLKDNLLLTEKENIQYKDSHVVLNEEIHNLKQCLAESSSELPANVPLLTSGRRDKREFTNTDMNNDKLDQLEVTGVIDEVIIPQEYVQKDATPQLFSKPVTDEDFLKPEFSESDKHENDTLKDLDNVGELVVGECDASYSAKTTNVSQIQFLNRNSKTEELEGEVKRLNNVIIELQASVLSREVVASAQKHVQNDISKDTGASNNESNKVSAQTNTEDTAYESLYDEHQEEVENSEVDILAERLTETQQELDRVTKMLHHKTKECEEVKVELLKTEEKLVQDRLAATNEDLLSESGVKLKHNELSKVSETSSVTSLEKEVNMHASSSLCLVPNDGVVTLDSFPGIKCKGVSDIYVDKDTFQDVTNDPVDEREPCADTPEQLSDESDEGKYDHAEKLMKKLVEAKEQIRNQETERTKLLETMKMREESLRHKVESMEEMVTKLRKEKENAESINAELQMKLKELDDTEQERKEKVDELCYENEKLSWERDQTIETLNGLEKEVLDMKTAKCNIEFQKIQYEEELNRVKERLEYLESSDNDILEIKDMLEKVQEERANIVRENEKLQCELSAQIEENERLLQTVECLQKEKTSFVESLKVLGVELKDTVAEYEECKSKSEKLEMKLQEVTSEKNSHISRFEGEIEGLLEENSTLKTCVQMKESEIEMLKVENERLNNFFPNIDEQTENSNLLKANYAELEVRLTEIAKENENLLSELMETQGKVAEAAEENEVLLDKCEEFQKVICELDDEKTSILDSIQRTRQEMNTKLKENDSLIEKYEIQLECLDQENSTLKTQMISLHQEIEDSHKAENDQVKNESDKFKREKEVLEKECEEYKTKVNDLEEELIGLIEQVRSYNDTVKEKEDVSVRLETHIQELLRENVKLKEKYDSIEVDLHELKGNETFLKEQMKIYESALNSEGELKGQEVERLNAQLELERKYKNKFESDLEHALCMRSQLETDNSNLKDTNCSLQKDLKLALEKNSEVEKHLNTTKKELENALIEKQSVVKEKSELCEGITEITRINEGLKAEVSILQNHLQAVSDNRNHIRNQIEILAAEIENLHEANNSLETQNRELGIRYKMTISENQVLLEENDFVIAENKKITDKLEILEEENILYKQRDKSLEDGIQENLNSIKGEMKELCNENQILTQENEDLKAERKEKENNFRTNAELVSEIERLNSENEDLKQQNEELESKFQSLREKLVRLDELTERNRAAELDNDALGERLDVLHKRISEIQKEKEALQKMTDDLTNMLHDMQTKYEEVKSEMESTKKKCDKQIEHLQNQLHEMNEDVSELRKMLDYMENEMYSTTEEKNILKENLEEQQSQFAEVVEQKQKLEEILSDKQQKDLKNMQMASQRHKNNTASNLRSEQDIPCNEPSIVQGNGSQVECSETAEQPVSEILRDSMDSDFSDIVPSFESAFHLLGLASSGETQLSSRMVQTNITVRGCENIGFFIDDNGDESNENRKELSETDCETQTETQDTGTGKKLSIQVLPHVDIQGILFEPSVDQNDGNEIVIDTETCQNAAGYDLDFVESIQSHNDSRVPAVRSSDFDKAGVKTAMKKTVKMNENPKETSQSAGNCDTACQTEIQVKSVSCQNDTPVGQSLQNPKLLLEVSTCFETDSEENTVEMYAGNVSVLSSDSGILSACIGADGKIQPFQYPDSETVPEGQSHYHQNETTDLEQIDGLHCNASDNISKEIKYLNACAQTDISFDKEIEKTVAGFKENLEAEHENKMKELEAQIETRILKNLEFREQKIQSLEENYERKVKQVEYDIEEKYEQMFRMREVEIIMETERDKKAHAAEVENAAEIKVEQIRREKDQQFVQTLQKVTADFAKKHRRESGDMRRAVSHDVSRRDRDLDVGPDGDGTGRLGDALQKLEFENQKLAVARDDLQQMVNASQQENKTFCQQLFGIMGEHTSISNENQSKNQQAPSWLDWDLPPELSFGSVRSSLDTKSLSGSLDTASFCTNSDCLNVRMKYGQLIEKIQQYLKLKASQVQTEESESKVTQLEPSASDESIDTDRDMFVEHDDDLSHLLYRGSSIDLEHCFRVPVTAHEKTADDCFVYETDDARDTVEINSDVIDILVKDSDDSVISKYNCEGHFSENEESDEENEGDEQQTKVSHWRGSASFVDERGSFSAEDSLKLVKKKRRYSESDLKTNESKTRNETAQSENLEGHFEFERCDSIVDAGQKPKSKNEDILDDGASDGDVNNDGVFEEIESTIMSSCVLTEGTQTSSLQSEVGKFIDERNDDKPPGLEEYAMSAKTEPLTGEETGDFFEEKIVKSVVLKTGSMKHSDTVVKSASSRRDLVDEAQNLDSDFSSMKQEYKKGQQSYENTVFDILNAICPGTDPGRRPGPTIATEDTFEPVIRELENTVDDFGESQNGSEINLQKLKAELGNMKLELQSLTKENHDLKQIMKVKELDKKKDVEILTEKIKELEKVNMEQKADIVQADQKLLDEKLTEEKCRRLEHSNKELLVSMDKYKEEISCLESDLDEKTKQNNELEMLKNEIETERNREKNLRLQYTEIEKLKDELEVKCCDISLQNQKLESNLQMLENSFNGIEKEMLVLKDAKSKLIEENNSLKSVIENNEEVLQGQEELKMQVKDLLKDKEHLKEELKEQTGKLLAEKDELEKTLIAQADLYDNLGKNMNSLDKENRKLEEHLVVEKKKTETLKETIEIEINENKSLKEDLEKEIAINMKLKQRERELYSEISLLKEEKTKINVQVSSVTSENEMLKVAAKEAVRNTTVLKEEKEMLNIIILDMEKKSKEMEAQLQDNNSAITDLIKVKQDLIQQVENLEIDAKALQLNVTEMTENVNKLTKDNETLQSCHVTAQGVQEENEQLKLELMKMKERNEENEWAIRELVDQVDQEKLNTTSTKLNYVDSLTEMENIDRTEKTAVEKLMEEPKENKLSFVDTFMNTDATIGSESNEKELTTLKEEIRVLKTENCELKRNLKEFSSRENFDKEVEALKLENETLKRSLDFAMVKDDSDTDLQIFEDMKDAIRTMQAEKSSAEQQEKEMSNNMEQENRRLRDEIEELYAENDDLKKRLKNQEESARKENGEVLRMYSDLRNEVEVLVISKHDLEIELHALKDLLEQDPYPTYEKVEHDTSKELTLQDLEEMEDLKASIENLKSDLKERDSYVRKLEEHLLNMDGNIPELTSTPKPSLSRGMPFISKSFLKKGQHLLSGFGRRAYSHDIPTINVGKEIGENISVRPEFERSQTLDTSMHLNDLNSSRTTEKRFHDGLNKEKLTSSFLSDSLNTSSYQGSFGGSERIRSGLKAEEDGHLALELKQFELVAEITKLRRDFRETKSLYAKETALLSEALEKEKLANELRGMSELTLEHSVGSNLSHDVLKLRKEVARLREQNKLLNMDSDRWIERLKEQEQIVADLKERISQNTSGYGEIEEVFGRQLALLQKQRVELIDQLKNRERENSLLSENLGEKGILEETLRKEKDILSAKLKEKEKIEEELYEKKLLLEKQAAKQKELEDIVYQKDLNEIELMKQKRILEEELREIESRFRDKEENLDFEKNKLLNELREKRTKQVRSRYSESDDEVSSVCSESAAFSERNIGRLEVMLEEVEKQHSVAVNVLRDQLRVKYNRREKELRKEHAAGIARLKEDARNQLESLRGQYETQLDSLRTEIDRSRERRKSREDNGKGGAGQTEDLQQQYKQVKEDLSRSLPGEQKDQLDSLVSGMDEQYQAQLEDMHRQHVEDVDEQVKTMRSTLEEIYSSQMEIVRSEMDQSHQTAILDLRETLGKDHKEELNRQEEEWNNRLEELKQDYERELKESKVGEALSKCLYICYELFEPLHKKTYKLALRPVWIQNSLLKASGTFIESESEQYES